MTVTTLGRLLFAGIPLLRRAPLTVLIWGVCLFPVSVLSTLLSGLYDGVRGPWAYAVSSVGGEWIQFGLLFANLLVMCAGMAILAAAVFRAVADPDRTNGRWMHVGSDEVRLCLVWCMLFLAGFAVVLVIMLVVIAVTRDTMLPSKTSMWLAASLAAAVVLARFVLAPAMTVFERRVAVADSWRMMRGRYGLAIVCALLFLLVYGGDEWLLSALGTVLRRGTSEASIGSGPFILELARYAAKPEHLVQDLARVVTGTLSGVIAYAPLAVLYRDLTGRNPADQAAVFD
jgi:hypothetical protein